MGRPRKKDLEITNSGENSSFLSSEGKENSLNVKWRDLVNESHLYINEVYYNKRGLPIPEDVSSAEDDGVIVRLTGLRDLARRHGFKSVNYRPLLLNDENCVMCCSITWEPTAYNNYREVVTEGIASGNKENLFGFAFKFKEANASNRAFARAVRDYFCIFSACEAELDESEAAKIAKSENAPSVSVRSLRSNNLLKKTVQKVLDYDTFEEFKQKYIRVNLERLSLDQSIQACTDYEDLTSEDCKLLIAELKKLKKEQDKESLAT